MLIKKIGIAKYALKMKWQGYQLLRNPKGTSPNILRVNIIRLMTHAHQIF